MTKKEGAPPLVMASRAGALTSFRAIITPRVNVDLPSILPPENKEVSLGQGVFLPFGFQKVDLAVQDKGAIYLFADYAERLAWAEVEQLEHLI